MTAEQEAHLKKIKSDFTKLVDTKYRQGQKEHGGDLASMGIYPLLESAIDETVDQVVYLLTLKQRLLNLRTEVNETFSEERED